MQKIVELRNKYDLYMTVKKYIRYDNGMEIIINYYKIIFIYDIRQVITNKIVQTAGKEQLGNFSPDFAHFNDDALFGENWNNKDIDVKTRCIITIVSLVSQGIVDQSLKYHLQNAKNYGVTKKEIASILTHNAFYAGWPKAWAAFNIVKDVWNNDISDINILREQHKKSMIYPIGDVNHIQNILLEKVIYIRFVKNK